MSKVNFRQHCEFHQDIPSSLRPAFVENEKGWAAQIDREEEYFTDPAPKPNDFIPIGVSNSMAMAFYTPLAPLHRNRIALVEQDQFAKVWVNTLLRCTFRMQYDAIHKRFSDMYKKDPSLHMAAQTVLTCEPLIKFRDGLPAEGTGLQSGIAVREDGKHVCYEEEECLQPPSGGCEHELVSLATRDYRNKDASWKTAMKFKCFPDTLPAAHLTPDNELYVAYYVSETCVKMMHFDECQKVVAQWYCPNLKGPLVCDIDVVTDGHVAYERGGSRHSIEGQIITAVSRTSGGDLLLGTFAGHLYNVTKSTFVKTRDILAILHIATSGEKYTMQTINDVTFDERLLNIGRPLCSAVKGTMVVSLSKYGIVSICFMGAVSFFKPPEGVTCDLNQILRYYRNGIWIRDDGGEIVVLYPDGRVSLRRLYKK